MSGSITILHIDTSSKLLSMAVSSNGEMLAFKQSETTFNHGLAMPKMLDFLLKTTNLSIEELNAVSLASGPGSYTGLRIGASFAKGLCFGLQIPLIAISTLQLMHEAIKQFENTKKSRIAPIIDARRQEVYAALFDEDGKQILADGPYLIDNIQFKNRISDKPTILVGDGAEKIFSALNSENLIVKDYDCQIASSQPKLAFTHYKNDFFADLDSFAPSYTKGFHFI